MQFPAKPEEATGIWHPSVSQIANANVTKLMNFIGLPDYDSLHRYSIERPGDYWRHVNQFCGVVWRQDYSEYIDTSAGKEFPKWFVGGKLNWTDTVFRWATDPHSSSRPAVIAETEDGRVSSVTYHELHQRVRSFAAGLRSIGMERGDRVGILMEPCIEAVISMLAVSYIGAIFMPLFSGFGADPIVARLSASKARALIATTGFKRRGQHVSTVDALLNSLERSPVEFCILKAGEGEKLPKTALSWHAIAGTASDNGSEETESNDPAMLFYTSGTTGLPKGTVHIHAGFPLKAIHDSTVHFDVKPGDVFFWPADMGWVAGAQVIAATMTLGATMVCYHGAPDFPDWSRMSQMVGRHKVTHFGAAPTLIRGLVANADAATRGDLSSIRVLVTGGEVISEETFLWYGRHFGGGRAPIINIAGGTEASGALVCNVIARPIPPGGFNTASPGIAVDVVDAEGKSVVDQTGELAIREPFVGMTRSFWGDDERYIESYWRAIPGIWIHGDLAVKTRTGEFFLRGRSDDTLKLAGKRTGPAEIEGALMELPGVNECAAIGVDDPVKGQMLVVFVVASDAAKAKGNFEDVVARHAENRLGRAFRPGRVHLVTKLPKTRTSKVMRRVIKGVYTGGVAGDLSSVDDLTALDEISRCVAPSTINDTTASAELGRNQ